MDFQYAPNKVKICKKDVCVDVYGEWAKALAVALTFAAVAYGVSLVVKVIK